MLEPREADIPALFLVFVVLPLPAYVLLGKWSEASKKSERVRLLAQLASEEAVRAEEMVVPDIIPPVSSSKNNVHACARCSRPTITRLQICQILF
ncbi:putative ubiquitinyl hydrolase 1 [Rosa chinensis]|uniref:Putative ubiquitinyl hydrolase 1 n=1 Tax=Rosa chinensis TaxID=74649 RepID=A0A2P6RYH5_ROSCH|nr:putative ubiquitinyl hydrolase 1 [Rosa chinensis]